MSTWSLGEIETKFRDLIGMPDTNQLSQANAWAAINDYYQDKFPLDSDLPEFKQIYTTAITAEDGVESYDCPDSVIAVRKPVTLFDADADYQGELTVYQDESIFYAKYPRDPDADTGQPASLLWYGLYFYLRPIPDAVYTVDMAVTRKPTTALTVAGSVPLVNAWGPALAYGAAIDKLQDAGDTQRLAEVAAQFTREMDLLTGKEIKRTIGRIAVPGF